MTKTQKTHVTMKVNGVEVEGLVKNKVHLGGPECLHQGVVLLQNRAKRHPVLEGASRRNLHDAIRLVASQSGSDKCQ